VTPFRSTPKPDRTQPVEAPEGFRFSFNRNKRFDGSIPILGKLYLMPIAGGEAAAEWCEPIYKATDIRGASKALHKAAQVLVAENATRAALSAQINKRVAR
jgi:hypothetical protein